MKILLILLGMLFVCGISGALLVYATRANKGAMKLVLHIGYAYTLIAFFVFYMQVDSAVIAAVSTVALPFVLAFIRSLSRMNGHGEENYSQAQIQVTKWSRISKDLVYPVAISLTVIMLAAWPYLLSGWGAYWHSGNYDMEDGLNGRDAYVSRLILDHRPFSLREASGDTTWYDFAEATGTLSTRVQVNSYKEWYAGDEFRFQYSSLAFWSALFYERWGLDTLLVQALLNLILMAVGIFYLSKDAFGMRPIASAMASVVSVSGTFYLTTYFAGHMGSMMYGALIPAVLYLVLVKDKACLSIWHVLTFGGLIVTAIVFTYPHPLVVVALPLLIYRLFSLEAFRSRLVIMRTRIKQNPHLLIGGAIILLFVIGIALGELWHLTESYRLRQDGQYRAWGYTHVGIIVPLFLGLIPSPMEGSQFLGSILGKSTYWMFILVSSLLAVMLSLMYFRAKVPQNSKFLLMFGLFWIAEYFVFRYFIIDSYYLYKFLYTNQFILVIGVAAYVSGTRSRVIKITCAIVVLANLGSVLSMANGIYHRSYNQNVERYQSLLRIDHAILQKSFVELTGGEGIAVRQTLKANGIELMLDPRNAEYFIVPSGRDSDITGEQFTETIADMNGIAVKRAPKNNYLMIRTWNEPEQFLSDPILKNTVFRWMGDGKNDNLGIYVIRPSFSKEMNDKFLRICFQKGPSAEESIDMSVSAAGKEPIRKFKIDGGVYCEWIPALQAINSAQPLVIHSGAKGKSLLPRDDRVLLYRVFAVGWTNSPYDEKSLSFFNVANDIIKTNLTKKKNGVASPVALQLGQGWGTYETYKGETFRWSAAASELVLSGGANDGIAHIALDVEPGPSHGLKLLKFEVQDLEGNKIFSSAAISGRSTIVLPLRFHKRQISVYKLITNSSNQHIANDPRILNYRVFSVTLQ